MVQSVKYDPQKQIQDFHPKKSPSFRSANICTKKAMMLRHKFETRKICFPTIPQQFFSNPRHLRSKPRLEKNRSKSMRLFLCFFLGIRVTARCLAKVEDEVKYGK